MRRLLSSVLLLALFTTTVAVARGQEVQALLDKALKAHGGEAVLEKYKAALKLKPDARNGQTVFQKNCATCHRIGTIGVEVGPNIADTLGKAYFDNGDVTKAVETQERAVKLAVGTPFERDPDLKTRLEQYRQAHYDGLEGRVRINIPLHEVRKFVWMGDNVEIDPWTGTYAELEANQIIGTRPLGL